MTTLSAIQRGALGLATTDSPTFAGLNIDTNLGVDGQWNTSGLTVYANGVTPQHDGPLHVMSGSAGTVTASTDSDELIVEASGAGGLSILTPSANYGIISFGSPTSNQQAKVYWNDSGSLMQVGTLKTGASLQFVTGSNTTALTLNSDQTATFASNIGVGGSAASSTNVIYYSGSKRVAYLQTSVNDNVGLFWNTNASFTQTVQEFNADRSQNSAYNFLACKSSQSGTPDTEFILRGDGNAYADGTWNNSGADFAEYMESSGEVIPTGKSVVIDNGFIREATASDNPAHIIGVVRPKEDGKASMIIGNTAWNNWTNKYLTDDFGVYEREDAQVASWNEIDENGEPGKGHSYYLSPAWLRNIPADVVVPPHAVLETQSVRKLNPAWSKEATYTPREKRSEWHIVGKVGMIEILNSTPKGDRWIKIKDISSNVALWEVR